MTPIVQLRKDPRAVSVTTEGTNRRTWQISSTHTSPQVLKVLGLKTNN
ncbi:MAG TPA: hypothetical protein VGN01_03280 [Acidobacteriaceae bacterium]|jgi:hypothetical protein